MGEFLLKALGIWAVVCCTAAAQTQPTAPPPTRGDRMIAAYFRTETAALSRRCLADVQTREDWDAKKAGYRRQLLEMLGLDPMPDKTELRPVITGKIDSEEFTVERLHFQSMPHLYVTANLYLPKGLSKPAPAILYVCGHAKVKEDGISFGNKTWAQYHGEWFARNGYVCLIIDSLELGEIEGIHHGTYNLGMWWWHDRGYTPAGVETWNGIRALDYLCSRPEVDPARIGLTGRSGGGAYTWYLAAVDERVRVACPVAGITDLENHVVDGTVEGHCDCMFMTNTYRWDFPQVAALVSPRPLLICNSDKDAIFPLDGVYRLHEQVRRIYKLQDADNNLGLLITEGPHKDTQDLQVPVFRWFNRFLKNDTGTVDKVATPFFRKEQLRVFDRLPDDQVNTRVQETFGPSAPPPEVPASAAQWAGERAGWLALLEEKTFAAWPDSPPPLDLSRTAAAGEDGARVATYRFTSEHDVDLDLFVAEPGGDAPRALQLLVLGEADWPEFVARCGAAFGAAAGSAAGAPPAEAFAGVRSELAKHPKSAVAWIAPRGVGPTEFGPDTKHQTQIRRRFALLGETLDSTRVWDVRRAIQAARRVPGLEHAPLTIAGNGTMAGVALYASLFEPEVAGLELSRLPASHRNGPDLLNVLRVIDLPAAVAMAAERSEIHLRGASAEDWSYPAQVARQLGWGDRRVRISSD